MAIFAVPIGVELRNMVPADISKRQFYDSFKRAWQPAGKHWHEDILPKHFKRAARDMYGHQKRKEKYLKRKKKQAKYGGMVDNVFSGASEEALKKSIHVKGSIKGATLRMVAPWYFTKNFGGHPDMDAEVTRMIPDDVAEVNKVMFDETMEQFNKAPTNKSTVII